MASLFSYVLSFLYIGIYWNNHHHLIHTAHKVTGTVLCNNLHLLFWLSLVPFATAWMGETHFDTWPTVVYGFVLLIAGVAYYFLAHCLAGAHGKDSLIAQALGKDVKGMILYIIGIGLSFVHHWFGFACYTLVVDIWFIPDRRKEKRINSH